MASYTQAEAKGDFLAICREVLDEGERSYVIDKARRRFLVLDPMERYLTSPAVDVTAQFFKDNFARLCTLVKDGLCFRITVRRTNRVRRDLILYARRHTAYRDPADPIIETWRQLVADAAVAERHAELMGAVGRADRNRADGQEEVLAAIRSLARGVARMAIGNRPFEEGEMPGGPFRPIIEEARQGTSSRS